MIRRLFPLAAVAVLWLRQLRFERLLARRQFAWESEAQYQLTEFSRGWGRWGKHLVREVERAFGRRAE